MRYFCLLLLFWLLLQSVQYSQSYVDTALSYVGVKELTGKNDGYEVEKFLKSVGLGKGNHWCAAFVSYCLTAVKYPFPVRSGLARSFVRKNSLIAAKFTNSTKVPKGALAIWQRGETIFGHIAIVLEWEGMKGKCVEGNVSNSVRILNRKIEPFNFFRIKWFTII